MRTVLKVDMHAQQERANKQNVLGSVKQSHYFNKKNHNKPFHKH